MVVNNTISAKLDIIICTYNRAEFLKQSIQSVLNQTYQDFNLIILDNCSTDETQKVVMDFHNEKITYICHNENIGADANFRAAFSMAKSEYFMVFHDDDIMLPSLVEAEIREMDLYPEMMMCTCKANVIDNQGTITQKISRLDKELKLYSGGDYLTSYLNDSNFLMFPSAIYRTDFMHSNSITFNSLAGPSADALIAFEVERCRGVIGVLNQVHLHYRHHANQYSNTSRLEMIHKLFKFLKDDGYYSKELDRRRKEQDRFYRQMLRKSILLFGGKKIDADFLLKLKKSYAVVYKYLWTEVYYTFIFELLAIFPKNFQNLYIGLRTCKNRILKKK